MPTERPRNVKSLRLVLGLTTTYLVAEVVGGLATGSLALLADAGHMLTDVGGLALALFAIQFAARPATPQRTYGYYRAEILAAVANAVALIVISLYVLYEAYRRFIDPPAVESAGMLIVAAIGLIVNVIGIILLRRDASESLNLKGAYFEVLSDLLSSVGVIVAGAIMWTTGWYYADPVVSAAIGLFILPRTWTLLREAVGVLLEGTPSNINLADVRARIAGVPGVEGVHDLHVWTLTSGVNALSAHVILKPGDEYSIVLKAVQTLVTSSFEISHATVQVEPKGHEESEPHL